MVSVRETLNLTDKTVWQQRPHEVAHLLGFKYDRECEKAMGKFVETVIDPAKVMEFAGIVAVSFLREHLPPLTRLR